MLTVTPANDVIQKFIINTQNLDHHGFFFYFNVNNFKRLVKVSIFIGVATAQSHLYVHDCKVFNFCNVWLYPLYLYDVLLSIVVVMSSELRRLGRK